MQEDYEEAASLKSKIQKRELVVNQINLLKQKKQLAVREENFEQASILKSEISKLTQDDVRLTFGKQHEVEISEKFGGTGEMMSSGQYVSPL